MSLRARCRWRAAAARGRPWCFHHRPCPRRSAHAHAADPRGRRRSQRRGCALVVTLTRSAGSVWLLTLSGEIDACDPALLSGYVSALDITLALTTRAASARVALAVASDLAAGRTGSERALDRALDRLRQALGASAVRFSAQKCAADPPLTARSNGSRDAASPGSEPRTGHRTQDTGARAFRARDRASGGPAVDADRTRAGPCGRRRARRLGRAPRAVPARPPREVDTFARRSTTAWRARSSEERRSRSPCSPARRRPARRRPRRCSTEARRVLRVGDEAGLLPTGDFVFLLPQTTAPQAPAVTRRLKADLARAAAAARNLYRRRRIRELECRAKRQGAVSCTRLDRESTIRALSGPDVLRGRTACGG